MVDSPCTERFISLYLEPFFHDLAQRPSAGTVPAVRLRQEIEQLSQLIVPEEHREAHAGGVRRRPFTMVHDERLQTSKQIMTKVV